MSDRIDAIRNLMSKKPAWKLQEIPKRWGRNKHYRDYQYCLYDPDRDMPVMPIETKIYEEMTND